MAEAFNERKLPDAKEARYREVAAEIASVLEGEPNLTARMATVTSMLASSFDHYFWTGFYVVDGDELVVGPYQGTLGCLRIAFGRGVCGTAAATGRSQIVDVNGRVLASAGAKATKALVADLDLARARDKRFTARNELFTDRRPAFYAPVAQSAARRRS